VILITLMLGASSGLLGSPEPVRAAGATIYVDDDYGNPYPGTGNATDPFHKTQMGIDAAKCIVCKN